MTDQRMDEKAVFELRKEKAVATGRQALTGFLVFKGSTAMANGSPDIKRNRHLTEELLRSGVLVWDAASKSS